MAEYTLEEIMCGEKYNIESNVFMEVFRLVEQKADAKMIREQLNTIYVKHALLTAKRMIKEGDSISDIPEFESLSFEGLFATPQNPLLFIYFQCTLFR